MIAGGGLAAQRCAETLRRAGYEGRIRIVCAEAHLPYDRPPLSKEVLADAAAEEAVGFRPAELVRGEGRRGAPRHAARAALDAAARRLALDDGRRRSATTTS